MRPIKLIPVLVLAMVPASIGVIAAFRQPVATKAKYPVEMTENFAVPVLMYHRISDLTPTQARSPLTRDLTVSPKDFEEQVSYLKNNGFSILSIYDVQAALLNGMPLPKKSVVITMDDGYRDNFEQAFPILQRHGVPATVFVVTSVVGDSKHLSWAQIAQLRESAWSFGSHTVSHPDLTVLPGDRLETELVNSKSVLEQRTASPVTTIAYPSGRFDDRVVQATQKAGYLTGWNKGGGPVRPGDDPFRLPRVRVHGRTTMADFKRKVWSGVWTLKLISPHLVCLRAGFEGSPTLSGRRCLLSSSRSKELNF
ncbi:MAG: polysaccharide deacetylase family protein [Fimbriimonadaceae bacterium]